MTLPTKPNSRAETAPKALFRMAFALSLFQSAKSLRYLVWAVLYSERWASVAPAPGDSGRSKGAAVGDAQDGLPFSPPNQPPIKLPAPTRDNAMIKGPATSQATVPCNMAGSECRMPATFPVTQPAIANAKKALNRLHIKPPILHFCLSPLRCP